jgi:hypothetical protein
MKNTATTIREGDGGGHARGVPVNFRTPSGTEKRQEREEGINMELPYFMRPATTSIILGGDLKCVLENKDSTGRCTYSMAYTELVRGFHLVDVWHRPNGVEIIYTTHGIARRGMIIFCYQGLTGRQAWDGNGSKCAVRSSGGASAPDLKCDHRPAWQRPLENERGSNEGGDVS